jgi:hypothetical protein
MGLLIKSKLYGDHTVIQKYDVMKTHIRHLYSKVLQHKYTVNKQNKYERHNVLTGKICIPVSDVCRGTRCELSLITKLIIMGNPGGALSTGSS